MSGRFIRRKGFIDVSGRFIRRKGFIDVSGRFIRRNGFLVGSQNREQLINFFRASFLFGRFIGFIVGRHVDKLIVAARREWIFGFVQVKFFFGGQRFFSLFSFVSRLDFLRETFFLFALTFYQETIQHHGD